MQKKTQKVKNNKKGAQTQKGGLFGFFKRKKTYDLQKAQAENKKKPIEIGTYKKIKNSPHRKIKNAPQFSENQLTEFDRLRDAALEYKRAAASIRQPRVYNSPNTGSARNKENPYYNIINNGYKPNTGAQPIPPPRTERTTSF